MAYDFELESIGGASLNGKGDGERDLVVKRKNGSVVCIIEAVNLKYNKKEKNT